MKPFIAGAGATNVDLLYTGIPRIPEVGEEVYCSDFDLQLGGGLPGTLINLGRLGIKTEIATELGTDIFSEFAAEQFANAGVDVRNLYTGSKIPLNITSAIILPEDRSFVTYGKGYIDASDEYKQQFYDLAKGSKITLMQLGGFFDVYKKLHDEGTTLVFDTGYMEDMSFETYGKYLEIADYYTPNQVEAMKITGRSTPEEAARELKRYFEKVIVKTDKSGCIGIDGDEEFFVPSIDEFVHVDSTGAGDAFLAGLCYGLFHDYPFRDCILFGNITGGKAVTSVGAVSAYFNEAELLEKFNTYKNV